MKNKFDKPSRMPTLADFMGERQGPRALNAEEYKKFIAEDKPVEGLAPGMSLKRKPGHSPVVFPQIDEAVIVHEVFPETPEATPPGSPTRCFDFSTIFVDPSTGECFVSLFSSRHFTKV